MGILAVIALIGISTASIDNHEDLIYGVYNSSCIETANYQYVFITCPDGENINKGWEGSDIWLENITYIGENSFAADMYYID